MWSSRPSAFQHQYTDISASGLMERYEKDNQQAEHEGVHVPSRRGLLSLRTQRDGCRQIRTCQWNVHYFAPIEGYPCSHKLARAIAGEVLKTEADIIVINEFGCDGPGVFDRDAPDTFAERLISKGYTFHSDKCFCPTAIFTRLPVKTAFRFSLDAMRAAICVEVELIAEDDEENVIAPENESNGRSRSLWVYGTHLEAIDSHNGEYRLEEIKALLQRVERENSTPIEEESRVLIVGDFNQQRQRDYTPDEWQDICGNKLRRGSPEDDGVSSELTKAGFASVWDFAVTEGTKQQHNCRTNWRSSDPPPATHWTGTIIDYTYFRGGEDSSKLRPNGVYVSPCGLSDHRMVVCDWDLW